MEKLQVKYRVMGISGPGERSLYGIFLLDLAQPDLTGDRAVALKAIKDETIELDKALDDKH
jgi:hypothetical protein